MSNSLLLHVGAPKTATTLVQWQFSGSDVLAANGVHYPEAGRDPDRIAHHVLGRMLMDCRAAEAAAMLQEEINPSGLTLVSSESMTNCIADPRRLPSFQAFLGATATSVESLRLLMFLREASDFFESMYLHAIKATGLKASFDDYLLEREGWYGRLFANLATLASDCPRMAPDIRAFVPHAYAADWSDVLGFDPQLDASQRVNPRLSLKAHPMALLRQMFEGERVLSTAAASRTRDGAPVRVAGVVLVRQRPGNGKAIFVTLEDETGIANVVLWTREFTAFRREVMGSRLMLVEGRIQRSPEGVVHVMGQRVIDRTADLDRLRRQPAAATDGGTRPPPLAPAIRHRHPRDARILPRSRDFP